jgi:predicted PurR-regulated permease PerM
MRSQEHPFSWSALFRIVSAGLAVYLVWYLFDILMLIAMSVMLAAALHPLVLKLEKRLTTTFASILVVFMLFLPIIVIIWSIIPNLIEQFPEIVRILDGIVSKSAILPPELRSIDFTQYAQNAGSYLLSSTSRITNFITALLTVLFLTLYFLIDSKRLNEIVLSFVPEKDKVRLKKLSEEITRINGQYIRGNLTISFVCGLTVFIGLLAIGMPYAAPLALFAAMMDLLPQVGAFIGAAPAVIIGFAISPTIGVLVLLLFIVYQQIENNILSPSIYNKALNLSPALSFIAVLIGASLAGVIGAFIALPVAASIPTIVSYITQDK